MSLHSKFVFGKSLDFTLAALTGLTATLSYVKIGTQLAVTEEERHVRESDKDGYRIIANQC